jgi:hypothetical protein
MPLNVLIVLDGSYWFGNPANPTQAPAAGKSTDFTYLTLVEALTAAGMNVTKAHRGADVSPGVMQNFTFTSATINTNLYDVAWLIGLNGRSFSGDSSTTGALSDPQINAIAEFMDKGGGVFATGDHFSLGAEMCGKIPRVRAMRSWYGEGDIAGNHMPANFPPLTEGRADTTRPSPSGTYTEFPAPFIWFENQSDSHPQPIALVDPMAAAIFKHGAADVLIFPDHMHEGNTQGDVPMYPYGNNATHGDTSKPEFRTVAGNQEKPKVVATGQTLTNRNRDASNASGSFSFSPAAGADAIASEKTVNTLSLYDGRKVGVGRIVTGATFHHYVDINLTGDTGIVPTPFVMGDPKSPVTRAGADAQKLHGFNDNPAIFNQIKSVFVNITNWLARPRPAIQLILERSTYSQDEANAAPGTTFSGVVLVTVDGLKPNQFPNGPITSGLSVAQIRDRGPVIVPAGTSDFDIRAISVSTDDSFANDRVQRITFRYEVRFTDIAGAFGFAPDFRHFQVDAALANPAEFPVPLADTAWVTLVKAANPFMLDLDGGNDTSWLSSDVKVFRVRQGQGLPAVPGVAALPASPNRNDALTFIRNITSNITPAQFTSLTGDQQASTLSSMPLTTGGQRVFNFALARVRLNSGVANAENVRVFFRMFTTQTTAALTYLESSPGVPILGYVQTGGAAPIALPGKDGGGNWISFPCFSQLREPTPDAQADGDNVQDIPAGQQDTFFGVLLDNNLDDPYPGLNPGPGAQPTLRDLLTGEHQCLVAQIEYNGAPIPSGATPWTSDKLSQRNLAVSTVANPGLDASRVAMHTFEIAATPGAITPTLPPDELLLDFSEATPEGTLLRLHIPSWRAQDVVDLADRFYARHEIEVVDEHTVEISSGGTRYIPIPKCPFAQTGVIAVEFPLGIKKGQRFDVSVRQITNRQRRANIPPPKIEQITLDEADRILNALPGVEAMPRTERKKGSFDLGDNRLLLTDLSMLDMAGDHALIIENPPASVVEAAVLDSGQWRETIGAFQLGVPVSTKHDMRLDEMRLLSVMRWRLAHMPRGSRWRKTMAYYVGLLTDKVQALGANPWEVPATPDGAIPQLPWAGGDIDGDGVPDVPGVSGNSLEDVIRKLAYPWGCLLVILLLLLLLWIVLT